MALVVLLEPIRELSEDGLRIADIGKVDEVALKRLHESFSAKGPKLELDSLRLVNAAQKIDGDLRCYLAVMSEEIADRAREWAIKYDAEGVVEVVVVPLSG